MSEDNCQGQGRITEERTEMTKKKQGAKVVSPCCAELFDVKPEKGLNVICPGCGKQLVVDVKVVTVLEYLGEEDWSK